MNQLFRLLLLSYFVLHVFCDEESFPQVLATYHLSFHNQPFSMWNHAVESNIHSGHHTGASWSPPRDICSSYYPAQGVYSSSDDNILEQHMKKLVNVGVNMIVVPFYLTQIQNWSWSVASTFCLVHEWRKISRSTNHETSQVCAIIQYKSHI